MNAHSLPPEGRSSTAPPRAAEWAYRGLWAILTDWFRVPQDPPTLPAIGGEPLHTFKPAPEWLAYLKFVFWVWLTIIDVALLIGWLILLILVPVAGIVTFPVFFVVAVVPDVIAYVAIHLRYDTTWYVLSPQSLRIRRGIWTIRETTLGFHNIQNVEIHQGPLQRWFGISRLTVQTAGGGGHARGHPAAQGGMGPHIGLIEGVANAREIRDLIMARVAASRSAGLGDEPEPAAASPSHNGRRWSPQEVLVLREIRDHALHLGTLPPG